MGYWGIHGARRQEIPGPQRRSGAASRPRQGWRLVLLLGLALAQRSGPAAPLPENLADFSLEALMDIEVTSVSKRPEKRTKAAAAIYVLTGEDIRRLGATSIPDALRVVPGLHVARIDANKWAITARGFNSRFANKLLVLLDGRSVYTPLFAGVYWEALETPLEDIERIEVIRGPGGTLWGANAVNGVINIITKPAAQTQGGLLSAGAGNEARAFGTLRYGGGLGANGHYRVYGMYGNRDPGRGMTDTHDDWELTQTGFRADWEWKDRTRLTLQGDFYQGLAGQQVTLPVTPANATATLVDDTDISGGNLLMRWMRTQEGGSEYRFQAYFDHVNREGLVLHEDRDTVDLEFQHRFQCCEAHDVLWGVGYRRTSDNTDDNAWFRLDPASRTVHLYSGFLQDEIALHENLSLIVGSKFEHNDFSGFEYQPNLRAVWTPRPNQTLWAAVSRAVRSPARGEHDVRLRTLPAVNPGRPVIIRGDEDFDSENLLAYEAGYRWQGGTTVSVDVAAFYNRYDELRTFDPEVFTPTALGLPFDNRLEGETYGVEVAAQWQIRPGWRLEGSYSFLQMDLDLSEGSADTVSRGAEDASPHHQASVRSHMDLTPALELDIGVRYVGSLETPTGDPAMPAIAVASYTELDARLAWRVGAALEVYIAGWNLLDGHHEEFTPDFIRSQPTRVERSVHTGLSWRF